VQALNLKQEKSKMHKCLVVRRRIVFWALLVLLLGVLVIGDLQAQAEKATLSGTVFDASGAVVVGATIQAKNINTSITFSAVTDGQGRYILPEMAVGTYDVSAEKAGFQKMVQTGIMLTVGARRILDYKLAVGQPVDVIEVTGKASTVDLETASVGALIVPTQMELLPLNGRNFTDLLSLAPGVATVPPSAGGGGQSATTYGQSTNYSVSGSRPVGMAYLLDNTDIRNAMDHGAGVSVMGTSLGMEAIQEFTILTNTYSAEFGGTGAAVNAVTKSGSNSLHGTAYEYMRNSALDAMNYFDVPGQKPSFKRNNFGGSLGGPIKKGKAFFFANYEGLRASTGLTSRAVVPTSLPDLYRAGGMTQNGSGQWVGRPFGPSGPELPINPLVQSIFELYPLAQSPSQCPNVAGINLLPGTGLFCSREKQIGNQDYFLGRVDYNLSDKDSLFARYARESAYQVIPYVYTQVPGYPELDWERNQYLTISERHMFSPRIVNEVRFGFVRLFTETMSGGKTGTGTALQQIPGRQDMDFSPGHGLSSLGPTPSSPSRPVMNRFSFGDSVFLSLGSHNIRFGATLTRMQLNTIWNQYSGGAWIFANLSGGIPGTPFGGALYGMPLLGVNGAGPEYSYTTPDGKNYPFNPSRHWRQIYLSPFIQDDWKITNRLTLNLGLRYEWASNPTTVSEPVFVINNLTSPTTTQDDFIAAEHPFISNPNVKNFDPRIGIAYDPFGDHKTSVRAGFGIFHEPVTSRTYANNNTSFHPNTPLFFSFFTTGLFPNLPNDPNQIVASPIMGDLPAKKTIAWYYALPNTVDTAPYVMQYNLTIQRELFAGTVLTVGYNGSSGRNLFLWSNANPPLAFSDQSAEWRTANAAAWPGATGQGPRGTLSNPFVGLYTNPNFQAVEGVTPTAHSSYNALQISLNRQFSASLVGNIAYTWSKCLDNASATNSSEQGQWAVYNAYEPDRDYGPCSFNSNHVFTTNVIYRLPFKGNRAMNGWQIGTIVTRYTGLPFNIQNQFGGQYQSRTGGATEGERPNIVPGCDPMTRKRDQWYNPECFVYAPYGTLGDTGRNSLKNPNFFNIDFSLVKDTKLTEKVNVQFRAEFFNILNHPNFFFGSQAYLMGTAGTVAPNDPLRMLPGMDPTYYSQLSNPAAYRNPTATSPGGAICNPSRQIGAAPNGPCYATGTGLGTTMPGSQRQIQFALKFIF
jgi:hypothetical protein